MLKSFFRIEAAKLLVKRHAFNPTTAGWPYVAILGSIAGLGQADGSVYGQQAIRIILDNAESLRDPEKCIRDASFAASYTSDLDLRNRAADIILKKAPLLRGREQRIKAAMVAVGYALPGSLLEYQSYYTVLEEERFSPCISALSFVANATYCPSLLRKQAENRLKERKHEMLETFTMTATRPPLNNCIPPSKFRKG